MAQETKGKFDTVSKIVAFIAIGGFLYWLSVASEPTEFAVAEEGEQAQLVTLDELTTNPEHYADLLVEVDGIVVQELLGAHVFLAERTDSEPYLVRLAPDLIAGGFQVLPGDRGQVRGSVHMMTDSLLEVWDAEALFVDPEQRQIAGAAESFLLAREMEITAETAEPQDVETEQD